MVFVVFNPTAGRGRARTALQVTEAYLVRHGMPYRVLTTTRRHHATDLVRELPRDATVLSVGGDGTAHEVAAACLDSDRLLGVIPSGSGDDFGFALGIDRSDVEGALDRVRAGRVRAVDAGTVNGTVFINAVGMGFDADVAAHVHAAPSFLRGPGAYLYAIAVALKDFELAHARVIADGVVVHDAPALLVSAQNGPRTGGSFLFAPEASVSDGELDLLIAGRFSRMGAVGILPRLAKGRHLGHPEVTLVRAKAIRVEWSRARPFHMEGEVAGPEQIYDIQIRPGSLRVLA